MWTFCICFSSFYFLEAYKIWRQIPVLVFIFTGHNAFKQWLKLSSVAFCDFHAAFFLDRMEAFFSQRNYSQMDSWLKIHENSSLYLSSVTLTAGSPSLTGLIKHLLPWECAKGTSKLLQTRCGLQLQTPSLELSMVYSNGKFACLHRITAPMLSEQGHNMNSSSYSWAEEHLLLLLHHI